METIIVRSTAKVMQQIMNGFAPSERLLDFFFYPWTYVLLIRFRVPSVVKIQFVSAPCCTLLAAVKFMEKASEVDHPDNFLSAFKYQKLT